MEYSAKRGGSTWRPTKRGAPRVECETAMDTEPKHQIFDGVAASPGIAFGQALVYAPSQVDFAAYPIRAGQIEPEIERFHEAVDAAKDEVIQLRSLISDTDESVAKIFAAHLGMLEDPELIDETDRRIRARRQNAESVLSNLMGESIAKFENVPDAKLASFAGDLRDVRDRILSHMGGKDGREPISPAKSSIVIAHDLAPSHTARMSQEKIAGFATDVGGPVSHTAVLAKALEIPAVVGIGRIASEVPPGTPLIIDGFEGKVIANPTREERAKYRLARRKWRRRDSSLARLRDLPAETRDGYLIEMAANIEFPSEIEHVISHGADSVGLFRTEFLYLRDNRAPTEEEQFEVYRKVLKGLAPRPIIFRTMDLGGDKFFSDVNLTQEVNPFLGLRGIRLCLRYPEIFRTQLRAILRASEYGKARIMFPLITGVTQVREAKAFVQETMAELDKEGVPYDREIEIGAMIEVPSAALTADVLAPELDFFSIGTNDLIQYTLAVDRGNEQVAHLYNPHHPAVLRLIRDVIRSGHRNGITVGVCGEMAGDPDLACLLVGMGVDELSMAAQTIPTVKQRLRRVTITDLKNLSEDVLTLNTSAEIRERMARRIPEIISTRARPARN